ncbi:glycosyltransferase [Streptomyces sp. 796.1]|uniref:glycosyltransferase n=1 Tax=Streptomyces sp. 796.1 TaxID=3163029 RepID=UPI0039C90C32
MLHVCQPVSGGVARVVADLVGGQRASGLRPVVACPPGGTLAAEVAAAGAEVLHWPARRAPGPALAAETARLARIIRTLDPDLVHTHSAKAGLAGRLAAGRRVPTLHQPHAWSFDAVDGLTRALAVRWERYAARWTTRLLCVSEDERLRGVAAGIAGRWAVVRNGVDTGRFVPQDPAARRAARAGLPGLYETVRCGPLVVCVGRLCRQKGQDVLLAAWPRIAAAVPGARLALVGDGPYGDRLRRAAPPDVVFAGPTRDPARWYAAADLVVLPSRWEGMALAPLEAMACGRPVVVTEVTGAREGLPPGHAAHCLAPPDDPAALARTVAALLADPDRCAALGAQARRHVCERHDVRRVVAQVGWVYTTVLGAAAAAPSGRVAPSAAAAPATPVPAVAVPATAVPVTGVRADTEAADPVPGGTAGGDMALDGTAVGDTVPGGPAAGGVAAGGRGSAGGERGGPDVGRS